MAVERVIDWPQLRHQSSLDPHCRLRSPPECILAPGAGTAPPSVSTVPAMFWTLDFPNSSRGTEDVASIHPFCRDHGHDHG